MDIAGFLFYLKNYFAFLAIFSALFSFFVFSGFFFVSLTVFLPFAIVINFILQLYVNL